MHNLEEQIAQWRTFLRRRQAIDSSDVEELESHLRDEIDGLVDAGLEADEAFLVAVKRLGSLDALSREFAREHSERLWKQLVLSSSSAEGRSTAGRREFFVVIGLAILAAAAVKLPVLFGIPFEEAFQGFYLRNASLLVLPILTAYFVWKRHLDRRAILGLSLTFVVAAVFVNVYPFTDRGHTEMLAALHLPIALWLVVGMAYVGGDWRSSSARMNFIRFSGELFIYFVLIGLGGGVLIGFTLAIFQFIGISVESFAANWLMPCGAAGALIVASWLVESKQSVIENMAPVLTRVFTPLFTLLLVAFLATMVWTGSGIDVAREVLIGFDLLLVLVLALLLYSVSARDPLAPPDAFDVLQLLLVVSALVVDVLALVAISGRITEFGFSPNKVAALGENVILLVNLAWSAVLYFRFVRGRSTFGTLERWQTSYLPVYSIWAAIVVLLFPPLFGYI